MNKHDTRKMITRRQALQRCLLGGAGLAASAAFLPQTLAAGAPSVARAPAKALIQIWMWGGPSHIDTFDPKPDAGYDYCGPFDKAIPTNVAGIRLGQNLSMLAKQADKFSIIRSMTHGVNGHETASYITQTGHTPGGKRLFYPSVGATVNKFLGRDGGYRGDIPPYVVLTRPLGRFSEVGFLGLKYKPFVTGGDPSRTPFAVEGIVQQGISEQRQRSRRTLLHDLDSLGKAMPDDPRFKQLDECEEKAYDMILGDAGKVFDLATEPDAMRERYGRNKFGQSLLAARRLVESGVPFVAINAEGWDTHKKHFEAMNRKLPEMDRAMAALLSDLSERGILDSTIVWWGGEFGRGPKVQWQEPWNGGRSHYGRCFSHVLAGGGFQGGQVIGASDATAENVVERPVHPREVIGSIYELLGIAPDGPMQNPRGLDLKVLPPPRDGKRDGRLREIM
jgi:Protein of unknown function (DUF1501)